MVCEAFAKKIGAKVMLYYVYERVILVETNAGNTKSRENVWQVSLSSV